MGRRKSAKGFLAIVDWFKERGLLISFEACSFFLKDMTCGDGVDIAYNTGKSTGSAETVARIFTNPGRNIEIVKSGRILNISDTGSTQPAFLIVLEYDDELADLLHDEDISAAWGEPQPWMKETVCVGGDCMLHFLRSKVLFRDRKTKKILSKKPDGAVVRLREKDDRPDVNAVVWHRKTRDEDGRHPVIYVLTPRLTGNYYSRWPLVLYHDLDGLNLPEDVACFDEDVDGHKALLKGNCVQWHRRRSIS